MTTIRIEGLQELRTLLQKTLPEHIQTRALQSALTRAARPILTEAKSRVPVKTGKVRQGIYSYRSRLSTKARAVRHISVKAGRKHGDKDAYYWKFVEFGRGVSVVGKKRGAPRGGERARSLGNSTVGFFGKEVKAVPARPFMRPAFEAKKVEAIERFRTFMGPEIQKAATRYSAAINRKLRRAVIGI